MDQSMVCSKSARFTSPKKSLAALSLSQATTADDESLEPTFVLGIPRCCWLLFVCFEEVARISTQAHFGLVRMKIACQQVTPRTEREREREREGQRQTETDPQRQTHRDGRAVTRLSWTARRTDRQISGWQTFIETEAGKQERKRERERVRKKSEKERKEKKRKKKKERKEKKETERQTETDREIDIERERDIYIYIHIATGKQASPWPRERGRGERERGREGGREGGRERERERECARERAGETEWEQEDWLTDREDKRPTESQAHPGEW